MLIGMRDAMQSVGYTLPTLTWRMLVSTYIITDMPIAKPIDMSLIGAKLPTQVPPQARMA